MFVIKIINTSQKGRELPNPSCRENLGGFMLKSYFQIALRNLSKNKIFSVINIVGLTVGLTCCILIAFFVYDELNYDSYPQHANQIYRVGINVTGNGTLVTYPNVN